MKPFVFMLLLIVCASGLHTQTADNSRWFDTAVGARGVTDYNAYGRTVGTGVSTPIISSSPALAFAPPVALSSQPFLGQFDSGMKTGAPQVLLLFSTASLDRSVISIPVQANFTKFEFSSPKFSKLGE